jgi:hypothetical protein
MAQLGEGGNVWLSNGDEAGDECHREWHNFSGVVIVDVDLESAAWSCRAATDAISVSTWFGQFLLCSIQLERKLYLSFWRNCASDTSLYSPFHSTAGLSMRTATRSLADVELSHRAASMAYWSRTASSRKRGVSGMNIGARSGDADSLASETGYLRSPPQTETPEW